MSRKILIWSLAVLASGGLLVAGTTIEGGYFWALSWVGYVVVGALILFKRTGNAIGRLLFTIGLVWSIDLLLFPVVDRMDPSVAIWVEMVASSLGYTAWLLMIMIPVLFPSGRPVDRLTATVRNGLLVVLGVVVISEFLSPDPKENSGLISPLAVEAFRDLTRFVIDDGFIIVPILLVVALASLLMRWRRSVGIERLQYRWLLVALVFTIAGLVGLEVLPDSSLPYSEAIVPVLINMIPIAIGIAVLRYRLYDVDLVINRAVLFGLLAAFITVVYSVIVVGLSAVGTQGDLALSIVATAVIAIAFEPVRLRAQRWADRLAYGKRATPYEVLSDLTQRLTTTESAQGLLDRTARSLADGTGAERAGVWVAGGGGFTLIGGWPDEGGAASVERFGDLPGTAVPIQSDGELLGALTVEKRRGDTSTPTEARLIRDLAGSSASLLRNLGLQSELESRADELASSRRRLVDVQDFERRRLERDLDEGAQQLVVSLKVKLNVASRLARMEGVEPLAVMLEAMDQEARAAITQIRSLARGLYPQILEAEGLAAAVRSIAEFAPVPVEVDSVDIGRLPPEMEATVFFCISEAITNAAKHAPGRQVFVNLARSNGDLVFSVQDQGAGFDRKTVKAGSGLRNMADRLDAVGGVIEIDSAPGRGTRISGRVPLGDRSLVEVG